jgi:hypothetical protein
MAASAKELPCGKIASFEAGGNKILVVNLESKCMHLGRFSWMLSTSSSFDWEEKISIVTW